jgi:hypothetical protein
VYFKFERAQDGTISTCSLGLTLASRLWQPHPLHSRHPQEKPALFSFAVSVTNTKSLLESSLLGQILTFALEPYFKHLKT